MLHRLTTGATGSERIYDGYPEVMLDMTASRTMLPNGQQHKGHREGEEP